MGGAIAFLIICAIAYYVWKKKKQRDSRAELNPYNLADAPIPDQGPMMIESNIIMK